MTTIKSVLLVSVNHKRISFSYFLTRLIKSLETMRFGKDRRPESYPE